MAQSIGINGVAVGNEFFIPVRRKSPIHAIYPTVANDVEEIINVRTTAKVETKSIAIPFGKAFFSIFAVMILVSYSLLSVYSFMVMANNAKILASQNALAKEQKIALNLKLNHSKFLTRLNAVENQNITISSNGQTFKLSSADITSLIDSSKLQNNKYSINESALNSYIDNLVNKINVSPINRTVITHDDGSSVIVNNGSNGFKLDAASISSLSSGIKTALKNGGGASFSLNGVSIPFATDNTPAGYKYLIEGNLTSKMLYAYQDGVLVKSFQMSAGKSSTPTPVGTFTIWQKVRSVNMWGYNPDGSKYNQPKVPYVLYFDKNGDAVHGNYWRPDSVFGNVNTSHGCLGLRVADSAWVYDWAPIGTTVVTHY
jgi:lipoprotein-anchoring transpeptidase ErfK/SrfK